jgi:preprotein translocase subunit SecY
LGGVLRKRREIKQVASAAEQLLKNLSWRSWTQAAELKKRLWFTLGVLIVYRLGTYIPLPGINPAAVIAWAGDHSRGFWGVLNMVSGGALSRLSIMALSLMPYISSSIIVQLMTSILPHFEALKKEGESGRRKLNQYTRYGTIGLATFESYGVAVWLSSQSGLVLDPGLFFYFTTMTTCLGATLFLMWLGEQVTSRGLGNGSSVIIYTGIIANLPQNIFESIKMGSSGAVSASLIFVSSFISLLVIVFIVFMERAYRKVLVQYPKRQVGNKIFQGEKSYLPVKINSAGVLPVIFAMAFLQFFEFIRSSAWLPKTGFVGQFLSFLAPDHWGFAMIQVTFVVFFSFFYTTIVFNPEETAENLRKNGGFVPGYRPGQMTVRFFNDLLSRLTVIGSAYLAFVVALPFVLRKAFAIPLDFSGTSFLIIVSVSMELVSQAHAHLISYQYDSLLKKKSGRWKK